MTDTSAEPQTEPHADPLLQLFADKGHEAHFSPGDVILRQGDLSDHALLLETGFAKVVLSDANGSIVLALREPPEIIGQDEALSGDTRFASVIAMTEVTGRAVSGADLRRLVDRDSEAGLTLARILSSRLRESNQARRDQVALTVTQRTAKQLVAFTHRIGTTDEATGTITLPITQQGLANWVGASREAIVKVLRQLRADGTVATERSSIVVHDLAALSIVAAG